MNGAPNSAAAYRQRALASATAGDDAGAARLFAEGLARFPDDAAFINSAGNFHAGAGRAAEALALFDRSLALAPGLHEAAINRAVVLSRLGRAAEASAFLTAQEAALAGAPRYWTARAAAEMADGDIAAAALSYDAALTREPANLRALQGRARAALERGESRAVADHERALTARPGDPQLLLGYAQALTEAGQDIDALIVSEAVISQWPGWVAGLELHAGLRWARGDGRDFVAHYQERAAVTADPAFYHSWAAMLSGIDRQEDAADVLAAARRRWPDDPTLALAEATAAGEHGDTVRAAALFESYRGSEPAWQISEARHLIRTGDPAKADALLKRALAVVPDDVAGWSLRDLCWRLLDDPRHEWLHGQPNLIRDMEIELPDHILTNVRDTLNRLHERSAMPIGQSVRDGSQTRGALFLRAEPELVAVAAAIERALERYRADLPPADLTHPLLRHREARWAIAGSWSIRLDGVGHHAAHIHPAGILSSAAYITVPAQVSDAGGSGVLELGRPPVTSGVTLPPLATIVPRVGHCALFPSTLYHGTRPISSGQRMTVAFDVTARAA